MQKHDLLEELGKIKNRTVLLVTGALFLHRSGWLDKIEETLFHANNIVRFPQVGPGFSDKVIEEAVQLCKELRVDLVLAVGGGSVIDAGKLIALAVRNPFPLYQYVTQQIPRTPLDLWAVPTTAGTGSEATQYAVYYDTEHKRKVSIKSGKLIPLRHIHDPRLLESLPRPQLLFSVFDTVMHHLEGLMHPEVNDTMTEKCCEGLQHILSGLPQALADAGTDAYWKLMKASYFGGVVINNFRTGLAHTLAHFLSDYHRVPHGLALAYAFPVAERYENGRFEQVLSGHGFKMSDMREIVSLVRNEAGEPALRLNGSEIDGIVAGVLADPGLARTLPSPLSAQQLKDLLRQEFSVPA